MIKADKLVYKQIYVLWKFHNELILFFYQTQFLDSISLNDLFQNIFYNGKQYNGKITLVYFDLNCYMWNVEGDKNQV